MKKVLAIAAFVAASICAKGENKTNTNASEVRISNYVVMNVDDMKVEFALDNEGRATSKTVYTWNNINGMWEPSYRYMVCYGEKESTLTFAKWNKQNKTFSMGKESATYSSSEFPTLIVLPKH